MKHLMYACVLIAAFALILGCSQQDNGLHTMGSMSTVSVGAVNGTPGQFCTELTAGQNIAAGSVCAEVVDYGDTEELCLTYTTTDGWVLMETHTWVGEDLADMPQTNKGNPKVGNFPYQSGDITGQTEFTVCIDLNQFGFEGGLDDLCDLLMYAAAHAVVAKDTDGDGSYDQNETAWGNGNRMVERGNWATYFTIKLSCENGGGGGNEIGETAFAYDCDGNATCFIGADFDGDGIDDGFNRWGWTNGPYAPGTYYLDIYAGAGQCDITKGTLVGQLKIEYDEFGTAVVTYKTCGTYYMDEVHLYIGNEALARDVNGEYTVAPGQYLYIDDDIATNIYSFTVDGLSGDLYVVAHAVVVGDYAQGDCGTSVCTQCDQTYLYATENNHPATGDTEMEARIYAINATAGTATLVSNIPAPVRSGTDNFNGNAWDAFTNRFYFTEFWRNGNEVSPLYFNDLAGNQQLAGTLSDGAACGMFYNGDYYYVATRTDDYYRVTFNNDGTIASETKIADLFNNPGGYNQGLTLAFGDIAVSPAGMVYGSATLISNGATQYSVFFRMNLDGSGYTEITTGGVYGAGSYQIAFGSDGTLYGVNARTPYDLIRINLTDGSTTFVANLPVAFSDLATGPCLFE